MGPKTRQLAFDWEAAGEARPQPSQGSSPSSASATGPTRAHSLMEAVVAAPNMRRALRRVRANQGSPGSDGMTVQELPEYLKAAWPQIRQELLEGTYQPQPVRRVEIPKPSGGKRPLGIPTALDRLIQQAILQVLDPLYDPTFSPHAYGFRPGKSAHQALEQAREYVAAGKEWVVDLDLEQFFDRVNHDLLLGRLARRVGDRRLLRLIRRYLEAGVMLQGVVVERTEGTPQGGPLSPLLANILLDELDRELTQRGHSFCRYADDCNIYVRSPRAGARVMASVTRFLERKLRLKVNAAKSAVARPVERKFLGYRIWGNGVNARLDIAPATLERFKQSVRRLTRRNRGKRLADILADLRTYTDGWLAYYWRAPTPWVLGELDGWIRRRLRCYQWKQWPKPRTRWRALRQAGVDAQYLRTLAYRQYGPWRMAKTRAMSRALPNAVLKSMGFHSLQERYGALVSR
jgi:RNA-directed DNA polymerase